MEVVNEKNTNHAKKIPINIISQISKSICKILVPKEDGGEEQGTGFFMYFMYLEMDKRKECLFTNYHVINQSIINSKKIIKIQIETGKQFQIELDSEKRFIKCYEEPIDISIIEINKSDNINKEIKFLYYDMNYLLGYEQYINHDIFTIEYPLGKDNPEYASGKIIKIIDKIFEHSLDTDYGSSGCPIISCGNLKVLGIHVKIVIIILGHFLDKLLIFLKYKINLREKY